MASRKLNALLQEFLPAESTDSEYLMVQPARAILKKNGKAVSSIRKSAGLSDELFERFYGCSLKRVAELGQSCPYSMNRHHAWPGGLVMHILDTAANAMRFRKGRILPIGASPEQEAKQSDLYTYAVFAAAVLIDLGYALSEQRITLHDRKKKLVCEWSPFMGPMPPTKVKFMKVEFRRELHRGRQMVSLMYIPGVLSAEGVAWLQSDPVVFSEFLHGFSDHPGGPIYQLVMKGRKASIASTQSFPAHATPGTTTKDDGTAEDQETGDHGPAETGGGVAADIRGGEKISSDESNHTGNEFRRWLEASLNESRFEVNKDRAPVHVIEKAYFLVVPRIFELFAAERSLKWEDVQREVEAMEIHEKNPEDEEGGNRWQARIQMAGKFAMVKGWIVPKENLEVNQDLEVNGQLAIRKTRNR